MTADLRGEIGYTLQTWLFLARRELTCLVDKVNAELLKREFKSFRAFMAQLDNTAPAGDALALLAGPCRPLLQDYM